METSQRHDAVDLTSRMQEEPWRYRFVQLLTALLGQLRRQGISHDQAFRDVLRFTNSLALGFPASEVRALDIQMRTATDQGDAGIERVVITPAFIGLLGVCGTLPAHDTERIAMRFATDRDPSEHALIDVFSNRIIGLYFEAWSKYRVEHSIPARGQDRLLPMLAALAGARHAAPACRVNQRVSDTTRAYYAALLRTRPVSAGTIGQILTEHFGVPIVLEQLVGAWDRIPENRRSTLGSRAPMLGHGAVLGTRLWRHDLRARLRIGPLDEDQLVAFLPGGAALAALGDMMRLFALPMISYEVLRLLKPACIKPLQLMTKGPPRLLGLTTFLTSPHATKQCPARATMLALTTKSPR